MERLVHPQPFRVRPLEPAAEEAGLLAGELRGVEERRELDELRLARGLDLLEAR